MSAIVQMRRDQVLPRTAALDAVEPENGALTVEDCAMYGAALDALRHCDALLVRVLRNEHAYRRDALTSLLEHARSTVAMTVERIYRVAAETPRARHVQAREAAIALTQRAIDLLSNGGRN